MIRLINKTTATDIAIRLANRANADVAVPEGTVGAAHDAGVNSRRIGCRRSNGKLARVGK
jgi:hypothetical protein